MGRPDIAVNLGSAATAGRAADSPPPRTFFLDTSSAGTMLCSREARAVATTATAVGEQSVVRLLWILPGSRRLRPLAAPQHPGGHARSDRPVREVGVHDRVRTDDHVAADRDAVEHLRPRAQPDVVAEHDPPRGARLVDDGEPLALELV